MYYWRNDWHWNAKGNKLAALLTTDFMIENNLMEIEKGEIRGEIKRKVNKGLNEFSEQWREKRGGAKDVFIF